MTLCRTASDFKQKNLQVCDSRGDPLADSVRIRMNGAVSDLHAADGRYHRDCCKSFMSHRSINTAQSNATQVDDDADHALRALVGDMTEDKAHVWNSVEIEDRYVSYGGVRLTRRHLIEQLPDHFGADLLVPSLVFYILVLNGNGVAVTRYQHQGSTRFASTIR